MITLIAAVFLFFLSVTLPHAARAHFGHLGEVAGHGHWIGIAALFGAAALGIRLRERKRRDAKTDEETVSDDRPEIAPESET